MGIRNLVPNAEDVLALTVEELAGVLLEDLNHQRVGGNEDPFHYLGFCNGLKRSPEYETHVAEIRRALMEAWAWLVSEGFLIRDASLGIDAHFLSRRARQLGTRAALAAYRHGNLLPKAQLHVAIVTKVYPAFLRGEYDTAVFQSFREVEVAVRQAGSFADSSVGVLLMRDAFRPPKNNAPPGPLTDLSLIAAEQEGMAALFAGAIALYKNPQSHRHVPTDPHDAAEVIMLASQLLRLVDRLAPGSSAKP